MRRTPISAMLFMSLLAHEAVVAQPAPVDEPGVCFTCHPDVEAQQRGPHVHEAFAGGKCSDCHNPHASSHAALLGEEVGILCAECHADVAEAAGHSFGHSPARRGECLACHDPHAASHAGLLASSQEQLCAECHLSVQQWQARAVVHAPVAESECGTCHDPHGSGRDGLLTADVPGLCFDCHSNDGAFGRAHEGRDIGDADCTACHDPHAADRQGLVHANQHAPFAGGNCATCHAETGGSFAFTGDVQELCLRCHLGVAEFEQARHHHNLDDPRSCLLCHEPHAAAGSRLLAAEQTTLCLRCHFDEAVDPEQRRHVLTHEGMTCTECHLPHGADNTSYLKTRQVELCVGCHDRAHQASHPVGPEVIDARTGESVTCLSCHKLHGAPFEDYLPLDPTMDLCIQCHKR